MILTNIFGAFTAFGSLTVKHWKPVMIVTWFAMAAYIGLWCIPKHALNGCGEVTTDTIYLPPDTVVRVLYGMDTVPERIKYVKKVVYVPVKHELRGEDSLTMYRVALDQCNEVIVDCDSALRRALTQRTYNDTAFSDSIDVYVQSVVEGRTLDWSVSYKWKVPERIIKEVREIPTAQRSVFIGVGGSPEFLMNGNQLQSVNVSLQAGYKTKAGHAVAVDGGISTMGSWFVGVGYIKHFQF
jgi:hypothetical protein